MGIKSQNHFLSSDFIFSGLARNDRGGYNYNQAGFDGPTMRFSLFLDNLE